MFVTEMAYVGKKHGNIVQSGEGLRIKKQNMATFAFGRSITSISHFFPVKFL
jgi:hypothetical protein